MRLLRLAVEKQRWDLAAHTIVLATARVLDNDVQGKSSRRGDRAHGSKNKEGKRCPEGQSER
ncbi:hypothetical protein ACFLV3_04085 [Chloroflexota bacterium]